VGELEAPYMSRRKLYFVANFFRQLFRLGNKPYLDVLGLLERCIIKIDPIFNYEVPEKWEYGSNIHALCDMGRHSILIRKDVYNGAYEGKGRDRLTVMHEISHYFLFTFFGCPVFRSFQHNPIPYEKDPEWQAMNLAGLIMCPPELIRGLTVEEIAEECGISYSAAEKTIFVRDEILAKGGKKCKSRKRNTYKKSP
jgi:hypothetical protein